MTTGTLYLSYFSRILADPPNNVKFSIVRRKLPFVEQLDINDNLINLAPPEDLLDDWKSNKISWVTYTNRYIQQLNTPMALQDLSIILKLLDEGVDVTVYCYCGKGKNCHRYILGDICSKLKYKVIDCIYT